MKKFYKRVNAKRLTIESMYTCLQLCTTGCKDCGEICAGSPANGIAIINTPGAGGTPDYNLLATGNIFG